MISSTAAVGAVSLLLDALPVIAAILIIISFARKRRECRAEEQELREAIREFEDVAPESVNADHLRV